MPGCQRCGPPCDRPVYAFPPAASPPESRRRRPPPARRSKPRFNTEEAVAYNRSRVATATTIALYRSGYVLPMPDGHLDDAVHALDFPYSVPSPETRAAIRAALAVLEADYTVTVTH
ncbi:hypothetical protein [Streptomyces sp. NPDC052107]|uniref:hypothetical protein n=1 Tax=Streptomyces sp. NPDC052107 TaxID=3155632 RepID=UPI0034239DEC